MCFTGKRLVEYAFTESWSADEVAPFLSAVDGFIQCDDYKGYGREYWGGNHLVHWAKPKGLRKLLPPPMRCAETTARRLLRTAQLGAGHALSSRSQPLAARSSA